MLNLHSIVMFFLKTSFDLSNGSNFLTLSFF